MNAWTVSSIFVVVIVVLAHIASEYDLKWIKKKWEKIRRKWHT